MSAQPLISVVVPTKGRPNYLQGCLSALAATDFPRDDFELVVVNDGGGPEVERVASGFSERLQVRTTRHRRSGPSAARNAGAAAVRGRYIAFTDDDCEPAPEWLREMARALSENPGAAAGGETRNAAAQSRATASQMVVDAVHAHFNRDPDSPRFFASNNLAFPAEPFLALGGFDEGFRYAEDRQMCERWIGADHRFVHAQGAVVLHMRTLTLRGFLAQHYGYGRGAFAFRTARPSGRGRLADHAGVLRALATRTLREHGDGDGIAIAGYVALSQLATATGFGRQALSQIGRGRSGS